MVHTDRFGFESPGEKQAGLGEDTSPEVLRLTTQSRPGLQAGGGVLDSAERRQETAWSSRDSSCFLGAGPLVSDPTKVPPQ